MLTYSRWSSVLASQERICGTSLAPPSYQPAKNALLVRAHGIEPCTSFLSGKRSTNELSAHFARVPLKPMPLMTVSPVALYRPFYHFFDRFSISSDAQKGKNKHLYYPDDRRGFSMTMMTVFY